MDVIMRNEFVAASGKIPNPGKHCESPLAAAVVRDVNAMRGEDRVRYT